MGPLASPGLRKGRCSWSAWRSIPGGYELVADSADSSSSATAAVDAVTGVEGVVAEVVASSAAAVVMVAVPASVVSVPGVAQVSDVVIWVVAAVLPGASVVGVVVGAVVGSTELSVCVDTSLTRGSGIRSSATRRAP